MKAGSHQDASGINKQLAPFGMLIGEWKTEGKHPLLPGVSLTGRAVFTWIEDGAFILMKASVEHEKFPAGVAIFGTDDSSGEATMLYFDERGISRRYSSTVRNNVWTWERTDPEFSQQFHCEIQDGGEVMISTGKMQRNGGAWEDDLELRYTRVKK